MGFIDSAKAEGAQLLTGGGKPADPSLAAGLFIAPTIFDRVTPAMRIGREEIFGPVMSVMAWDNFEDMLATVNGVEYGLTASIVTNDLAKAMETAERVEAAYVWINSIGRYIGAPYGGWKQSGIGEEECFDEILSYTQVKNINCDGKHGCSGSFAATPRSSCDFFRFRTCAPDAEAFIRKQAVSARLAAQTWRSQA